MNVEYICIYPFPLTCQITRTADRKSRQMSTLRNLTETQSRSDVRSPGRRLLPLILVENTLSLRESVLWLWTTNHPLHSPFPIHPRPYLAARLTGTLHEALCIREYIYVHALVLLVSLSRLTATLWRKSSFPDATFLWGSEVARYPRTEKTRKLARFVIRNRLYKTDIIAVGGYQRRRKPVTVVGVARAARYLAL